MSDLGERPHVGLARRCEDAASGLHNFRDQLPGHATRITASIGKLFSISSQLLEVDNAQGDRRYAASFHLIRGDWDLLRPSLKYTLNSIFDAFAKTQTQSYQAVWEGLSRLMDREEGIDLLPRLEWYQEFLDAQFAIVTDRPAKDMRELRRVLVQLIERQEDTQRRTRRSSADISGRLCIVLKRYRSLAADLRACSINDPETKSRPSPTCADDISKVS